MICALDATLFKKHGHVEFTIDLFILFYFALH